MNLKLVSSLVRQAFLRRVEGVAETYIITFGLKRSTSSKNPRVCIIDGPLGTWKKPLFYLVHSYFNHSAAGHLGGEDADGSEITVFPEFKEQAEKYAEMYKKATGKEAHIVFLEVPKEEPKKLEEIVGLKEKVPEKKEEKPVFKNPFDIYIPQEGEK